MQGRDIIAGALVGIAIVVYSAVVFAMGAEIRQSRVMRECELLGVFTYNDTIYECHLKR